MTETSEHASSPGGPPRSARTLVVMLLAVIGVLTGLLAMHTVTVDATADDHSMAAMGVLTTSGSVVTPATGGTPSMVMVGEPGEQCGSGCLAMQMACALGILIITIVLLRRLVPGRLLLKRMSDALLAVLPPPRPPARAPSLEILCISRT